MGTELTRDEHISKHKELHHALDELVADWISHGLISTRLPSKSTIMELMHWSYTQTKVPDEGGV